MASPVYENSSHILPVTSHYDVTLSTQSPNSTNATGSDKEEDCTACFIVLQIIQPIIYGLITIFGILGNGLVMYVILSRKKMRTVTNLLLLNLAVADLSFVIICPPFTAYQTAKSQWPLPGLFGVIICKIMHYLLNVTVYVTIYTLVLISAIRYMTIVHNTATIKYRTKRNIIFMIIAIWVIMSSSNIPIITSHGVHYDFGPDTPRCEVLTMESGKILYTAFFIFAYILPLTAIAILSLCIVHHIKKQRPVILGKRKSKSSQKKKQAGRVLILVVVIFAIFWLPVQVYLLLSYWQLIQFESKAVAASQVLWSCLAYFNSCVNPVIYNYASQDFRECFREVMCCRKDKRYVDSEHQSFCTKAETAAMCPNGQNRTTVTYLKEDVSDADDV